MKAENYVNDIVRKIQCGGKRKREIRRQLLAEIQIQVEQGNSLEDVIGQMGAVKEIAEGFNENLSEGERKRYARTRLLKFLVPIALAVLALVGAGYWFMPKAVDLSQSQYFDREALERKMQETVTLFNAGDYEALRAEAAPELQPYLTAEAMEDARKKTAADWGGFQQFGASDLLEVTQGNQHFAVGEIAVTYENVKVIFRLTYDEEMKLSGIYMR